MDMRVANLVVHVYTVMCSLAVTIYFRWCFSEFAKVSKVCGTCSWKDVDFILRYRDIHVHV